jgi:hypothetical protein
VAAIIVSSAHRSDGTRFCVIKKIIYKLNKSFEQKNSLDTMPKTSKKNPLINNNYKNESRREMLPECVLHVAYLLIKEEAQQN